MAEAKEIVENLQVKINKLVTAHKAQFETISRLGSDNQKLNNVVDTQQKEIAELNNKIKMVKLAKSLEGSDGDSTKLKLKINEVVREVDKCIAMLNK